MWNLPSGIIKNLQLFDFSVLTTGVTVLLRLINARPFCLVWKEKVKQKMVSL